MLVLYEKGNKDTFLRVCLSVCRWPNALQARSDNHSYLFLVGLPREWVSFDSGEALDLIVLDPLRDSFEYEEVVRKLTFGKIHKVRKARWPDY